MTPPFDPQGQHRNRRKERQRHGECTGGAEFPDHGNPTERRQCKPPIEVMCRDHRSGDKEHKGNDHAAVAAPHGKQSAAGAGAAATGLDFDFSLDLGAGLGASSAPERAFSSDL